MSAEGRRACVIRAAMSEFAHGGYHGTSTEAIARRVGVSQPYLFRLFPNKRAIFLAAAEHCLGTTREALRAAARDAAPENRLAAMAQAYQELIRDDPERLLMQLQTYAAVAGAAAADDPGFGEAVREWWQELRDTVHGELGAETDRTTAFLACGELISTLVSLGFPSGHRSWQGFPGRRPDRGPRPRARPIVSASSYL